MTVIESRLDTVTLYHQGARVVRTLAVTAVDGKLPASIEVPRLPLALFDPTVRVRVARVDGDAADVTAAQLRVGLWIPPRDAPLDTPEEARIRAVRRDIQRAEGQLQQLAWEAGQLAGIPIPDRPTGEDGRAPPPSPTGARVLLEEFVQEGVRARLAEERAHREKLRLLREDLAVLEEKLARASSAREVRASDLFKSVTVELVQRGGAVRSAELELEYLVPGARWAPAYQCRMARDCRSAELIMRASICQQTGEDWKGVKVILSTAAPLSWTEIPELSAVRIGRAQPPAPGKAGFRPPPQGGQSLFADYDRDRGRLAHALSAPASYSAPLLAVPGGPTLRAGGVDKSADRKRAVRAARMEREMTPVGELDGALAEDDFAEMAADDAPAMMMEEPPPPPPPPSPPPARMMAKAAAAPMAAKPASAGAPRGRPGAGGAVPREGLEIAVFAHLRLPEPSDGGARGRLSPVDTRRQYQESLTRMDITVSFDVMSVVAEAERRAGAAARVPLPAGCVDVRQAGGHFDFSYEADNRVDVPSDGAFHSVPVGTRTADATVVYVVVPREDTQVFRQAMVQNPRVSPIITGPAEVYVAGEYVLSTTLPTVPPRGEFKLGLGVEQAIRCARNAKFREARSGTKVVATTELWHDLAVDLVNNLDREVTCEVRERIPQPAENAEVVVEEGEVSPAWEAYDQSERSRSLVGGRRWRVDIPAHGSLALKAQYVVKLYAQNELEGGNRREA
ncbi:MAG: DUF4139 domain-containing protein [Deltaproteobacteria bacterium]|nr:DUF4139 domain-containing protein [Deltaproteobacteria bacterium]